MVRLLVTSYSLRATDSSFRAERHQGIDFRGAAGGEPTGEQSDDEEENCHGGDADRVRSGQARHERTEDAAQTPRAEEAGSEVFLLSCGAHELEPDSGRVCVVA